MAASSAPWQCACGSSVTPDLAACPLCTSPRSAIATRIAELERYRDRYAESEQAARDDSEAGPFRQMRVNAERVIARLRAQVAG